MVLRLFGLKQTGGAPARASSSPNAAVFLAAPPDGLQAAPVLTAVRRPVQKTGLAQPAGVALGKAPKAKVKPARKLGRAKASRKKR